ncbi:ABC transporter permease [Halobacteria archaeon AArc-curdl1]|uniref:ABC transporter permease n=1 Tax=Natronosalvus hydrolyticus TaxID=2979988 RepID=A0AAP3E677_9EURY|nr:ABC transporter permease [Halobacteria archaeon AArc-curdl1]
MSGRRTMTMFRISFRETARNYVLVGLLIALPIAFITVAFAVTQDAQMPIELPIDGETQTVMRGLPEVHGVAMTPLTSTIIAGIVGLLLMQDARNVDGRLVLAGYRAREVILARLGTLSVLVTLVTVVTVGVMAYDVRPEQPMLFVLAIFVVTLLYGFVGMLLGVVFDRVAGLWTILVASMLDIGLFQSPLFPMGEDTWWVKILPGYHPMEVVFDAGLTAQPDTLVHLGWSLGYLFLVGTVAVLLFYRLTGGQQTSRLQVIP